MRAPSPTIPTDERIARILNIVGRPDDTALAAIIRTDINDLHSLKPPSTKVAYQEYAEKMLAWIAEGEALLSAPPEGYNARTFSSPEDRASVEAIGQRFGNRGIEALLGTADNRWMRLSHELTKARAAHGWIIKLHPGGRFGVHGKTAFQRDRAATAAAKLMKHCGLPLTIDREAESAFCQVAAIYHEEITGSETKTDIMRRACTRIADFFELVDNRNRLKKKV